MRIGAHLSIAKGLDKAVEMAVEIGANAFQFFTRNPRGGAARKILSEEIEIWHEVRKKADIYPIAGHMPYTVNLGASDSRQHDFVRMVLHDDTLRVAAIGGEYLICHPGRHDGSREASLNRIVEVIKESFLSITTPGPMLLLETMAGQGKEVGTIDDLRYILSILDWPDRIGICLDSAHLFAAGWDLRDTDVCRQLVKEIDARIGFDRVKVMHLNDSLAEFRSHRDRHANIGRGKLGEQGIGNIVNDRDLGELVHLLETPVDNYQEYAEEIKMIKSLKKNA